MRYYFKHLYDDEMNRYLKEKKLVKEIYLYGYVFRFYSFKYGVIVEEKGKNLVQHNNSIYMVAYYDNMRDAINIVNEDIEFFRNIPMEVNYWNDLSCKHYDFKQCKCINSKECYECCDYEGGE